MPSSLSLRTPRRKAKNTSSFFLAEETLGYVTAPDPSNIDKRLLVAGSQNTLIDYQKKVRMRAGYTRLGAENTALTNIRNAWTWKNSKGDQLAQRFYDDELEVYLGTVDDYPINAWTRVKDSWSASEMLRSCIQKDGSGGWYDSSEKMDLQIMVNGDANLYEWNGAVAVASVISSLVITEAGDAGNMMSSWSFSNLNATNSNAGILYWELSTAGGTTHTVNIYKDSAGLNLVASGTIVGDGTCTLTAQNGSGLSGSVVVVYGGHDDNTISANTLTCSYTLTKRGTNTFAQNRFYTTRNKSFVNIRTGAVYSYSGGESTTSLTGVIPATGTIDILDNDILIQSVVTQTNKPASSRTNHFIGSLNNQIAIGSEDDNLCYISKDTDYTNFAFNGTTRVPGEGVVLTLDNPVRAIAILNAKFAIFAGLSSVYQPSYSQITVSTTLYETVKVEKTELGVNQGPLNQEVVVPVGNALAYLSNEVALRIITNPSNLIGFNTRSFSNPIKPDFDAENWANAFGFWYKNILFYTAPANSKMYMLNFIEDADGVLRRFWNPPQIFPVGALSVIDSGDGPLLHGHSNIQPESYLLFDGQSDGLYSDIDAENKLAIHAIAAFAYNNFGDRARLKNFDEYYVEGEITPSTIDLKLTLNYEFGGAAQVLEKTIDGSDDTILEGTSGINSLGQASTPVQPLGGLLNSPDDAMKFRTKFEIAKEDFHEIQEVFETNAADRFWSIISRGMNVQLSPRKDINIKT